MGSEIIHRQQDEKSSHRIIAFTIFIFFATLIGVLNQQLLHSGLVGWLVAAVEMVYVGFICFVFFICTLMVAFVPLILKNSNKVVGSTYKDSNIQSYVVRPFDLLVSLYYPLAIYFGGHPILAYIILAIETLLIAMGIVLSKLRHKF